MSPFLGKRPKKQSRRQRKWRQTLRRAIAALCVAASAGALASADRLGCFGRATPPDREKYDGQTFLVVRVVDGDTLDVGVSDGQDSHTRIRLWGVDTPEVKWGNRPAQHFGEQASEFTKAQTWDELVRLKLEPSRPTRDKYGRLLAFVYLPDGRILNRVLIEEGYGYADPRFDHTRKAEFRRLQREAKEARRGLWRGVTDADLPYYYRDRLALPAKQKMPSRAGR